MADNNEKNDLYEKLKVGITNVLKDENFKNWLNTSGSFYTNYYSLNNALLIYAQNPEATYVKGYEQWKDFGRQVNKDEHGIYIYAPVKAYEKKQGDFLRYVKDGLKKQLEANPLEEVVSFNLNVSGTAKITQRKDMPGEYGLVINGKNRGILTEEQLSRFIRDSVLDKMVQRYTAQAVFDIKQCSTPEHLWLKEGKFKKEDLALSESGEVIKSKSGLFRVKNSDERKNKFNPDLGLEIKPIDEEKANTLFTALKNISENNGVPVYEVDRNSDETLKNGAGGYFTRKEDERNAHNKGYIVLPNDVNNKTELVSVMIHEMAHSDIHGSLENAKLYDRNVRELHAEATAYSVASQFGIETGTSSFKYLATWQKGLDFKELQKNLGIIYNESRNLTKEIKTELDRLGYNLDLTKKNESMSKESLDALSKEYVEQTVPLQKIVDEIKTELPQLLADNKTNKELVKIIKDQAKAINKQQLDLDNIYNKLAELKKAVTLDEQNTIIEQIDSALARINQQSTEIEKLSDQFIDVAAKKQTSKMEEFRQKPMTILKEMSKDSPVLKDLSKMQLAYIAKSKYISRKFGELLEKDPKKFAELAAHRAMQIDNVISKSQQFVEINYCENWFKSPIFEEGQMMHPKNAETISKQAEKQIAKMQNNSEEYIPYTKCSITIFDASGKSLAAYSDRIDIGDGYQASMCDYFRKQQSSKMKFLTEGLEKAIREKSVKDKIYSEPSVVRNEINNDNRNADKQQSMEKWKEGIAEVRQTHEAIHDGEERGGNVKTKEERANVMRS